MSDTILRCPRDQVDLEFEGYWKYPRHRCAACGGYLIVEADALQMLGHSGGGKLASVAKAQPVTLPATGLACPRDGSPLRTLVHDDVELGVCESCTSAWAEKEEFQKLATKGKAGAAETVGPVDYVAKMDKRRWIASRFLMPPTVVGFVGLLYIGGNCAGRGWEAFDPYQPWFTILLFCAFGGIAGHVFTQRCPKCEKLFQDNDGINLITPDECPNCGTQLR